MAIAALGLTTAFQTAIAATSTVAAGAAVAGTVASAKAARQQASTATQVANYNANLDIAQANQNELNANANITAQRQKDNEQLSVARAQYAASGVMSDTGSPMEVLATSASRDEQNIQQYYAGEQESAQTEFEAAQYGVYTGAEQASAYHLEGAGDIFSGIGSLANIGGSYAKAMNT